MSKVKTFIGLYQVNGKILIPQEPYGFKLVLGFRSSNQRSKPQQFIIQKPINGKSKGEYISSLYPTGCPNTFGLEYENRRYTISFTGDVAEVKIVVAGEDSTQC